VTCRVARPGRSDQKAEFAARLAQHHTQIFGYIYSLVCDLDDADDLFQQTSLVSGTSSTSNDPSRGASSLGLRGGAVRGLEFLAGAEPQPALFHR